MKRKELERRECELRDIERKFWDDVPGLAMELGISAGRGNNDSEESKVGQFFWEPYVSIDYTNEGDAGVRSVFTIRSVAYEAFSDPSRKGSEDRRPFKTARNTSPTASTGSSSFPSTPSTLRPDTLSPIPRSREGTRRSAEIRV
jgi:hypothetical protein